MDDYKRAGQEGAQIFRLAIAKIKQDGWAHNSMEILLSVSHGRWPQPMAVLMYSELTHVLGPQSLTQFDEQAKDGSEVIELFEQVASNLESA